MKSFLMLLLIAVCCAGCAPTVIVDGKRYTALSTRQKSNLIAISREALKKNLAKRLITREEYLFARNNQPVFQVKYRGDCYGSAVIIWRTPGRLLEFHYENDLTAEKPVCAFSTGYIPENARGIQPDKSLKGR